jgi:hypothetical protein
MRAAREASLRASLDLVACCICVQFARATQSSNFQTFEEYCEQRREETTQREAQKN